MIVSKDVRFTRPELVCCEECSRMPNEVPSFVVVVEDGNPMNGTQLLCIHCATDAEVLEEG